MGDLALQVRQVDRVVVHDPDAPDTSRREVQHEWRSKAPGADHEDAGRQQLLLPGTAHLWQDDVAGIALDLLFGEIGSHAAGCPRPVPVDPKPLEPRWVADSC